jgi:TolB protein
MDDEAFSPDGSQLAYQAGPNVTIGSGSVYIFNLNTGGSQRRLDTLPAGGEADPTWSPDGSLIAFRRQLDDGTKTGNFDIFVAPPDGSRAPKDVVTDGADEQDPSWSPDGSELAYKSSRLDTGEGHGPVRIWLGNADGSDARVLWTHGGGTEQTAAAWTRR